MPPKLSIADSIAGLLRRYPGALVCVQCARLIASTPAGYARSNLTPEQVQGYVCSNCRSERQIAAERSARLRTLKPPPLLNSPLLPVAPAGEPEQRQKESDRSYHRCVERRHRDRAASYERLGVVAAPQHDQICLVNGQHAEGSEYARECPLRKSSESLPTDQTPAPPVAHGKSRSESSRQHGTKSGTASRLRGRRLAVRRQRTSQAELAALARINAGRRTERGEVA